MSNSMDLQHSNQHMNSNTKIEKSVLVHPDGRRIIFVDKGTDTKGSCLIVEHFLTRPGAINGPHWHPGLTETFTIKKGKMKFRVDDQELILEANQQVTVLPNQVHQFWNISETETQFIHEIRPPGKHQKMFELVHRLECEGKMNAKGIPTNPLWLGLLWECMDGYIEGPPPWVQTIFFKSLAFFARIFRLKI